MDDNDLVKIIMAVVASNIVQSLLTVKGLKVHIEYLKAGVDRAHRRIDTMVGVREDGS